MIAALLLGGCLTTIHFPPDFWPAESADTGRWTPSPSGDTGEVPRPEATWVSWGCDAAGAAWTWEVVSSAWTGDSWLELVGAPGDETHLLELVDGDPEGGWDARRAGPLLDGADPAAQAPNVDTRFDCEAPEAMSFALRIYDPAGTLTDCVVGGADPAAATVAVRRKDPGVALLRQCRTWDAPSTDPSP